MATKQIEHLKETNPANGEPNEPETEQDRERRRNPQRQTTSASTSTDPHRRQEQEAGDGAAPTQHPVRTTSIQPNPTQSPRRFLEDTQSWTQPEPKAHQPPTAHRSPSHSTVGKKKGKRIDVADRARRETLRPLVERKIYRFYYQNPLLGSTSHPCNR